MSSELVPAGQGPMMLADPVAYIAQASKLATALAGVINERHLFAVLDGRKYVLAEGWTLLANMLGVHPVVAWSRPCVDHEGASGWEARVEILASSGAMIGAGEAMCSRSEVLWGGGTTSRGKVVPPRDDYALRAMAQTRAVSRGLRNPLGFVVKLAGYEATPAEEMPSDG